jgi:hypothetical protein
MDDRDVLFPAEKIEESQAVRHAAWLVPMATVAGIECSPLSLRTWIALDLAGSPILQGSHSARVSDLCLFVWYLSKSYSTERARSWPMSLIPSGKRRVVRAVMKADLKAAFAEADDIVHRAFADAPHPSGSSDKIPRTSILTNFIDLFASEYGWTPEYVLDLPLDCLWGLNRRVMVRNGIKDDSKNAVESALYRDALVNANDKSK